MYDSIVEFFEHKIIIISPNEIDNALNDNTTNLNWLEADTSVKIINELKPKKAILDAPSNNPKKYKEYVTARTKAKIIAEHKADSIYPVVSAASIIAKVTRDREIEKIKQKIKLDIGSGYPSDPITIKFLENNYSKYPEIIRKTWQTYKDVVNKKNQSSLKDF